MQNRIFTTQAEGISGKINKETPVDVITRVAEDENCIAGNFVFEGTDGETQAVGINPEATEDEILGIVKRDPFLTGVGNNQINPINSTLTIVNAGNVEVNLPNEEVNLNDSVYVDSSTGLITTQPEEAPATTQALTDDRYISLEFTKVNVKPETAYLAIETNGTALMATALLDYPLYSPDGITFTQNKTLEPFHNVAYGDNKWVGVGSEGIYYSTDGVNFTKSTGVDGPFTNIIYGDGKFVAFGGNTAYSTDGVTFTKGSELRLEIDNSITYGNGVFIIVGSTKITIGGKEVITSQTLYSTDGINFTEGTIDNTQWVSVIYGNNLFVAVAKDGSTAYSANGINFTMGQKLDVGLSCIGFNGEEFVAVATNGSKIAYSTDGKTFTLSTVAIPQSYGAVAISGICFANNKIYLSGLSTRTQPTTQSEGIICTINNFPGNFKFIAGEDYSNPLSTIAYGKNEFVAVGKDSIGYSTDGINFTAGTITAGNWKSILYDDEDDMFITISSDGKTAHSTDGINFTPGTIPDGNWECIAAGTDEYMVVGTNIMCYSADGIDFTIKAIPTGNWSAVAYGEASYTVVSSNGKAIYTTERLSFGEGTIPAGNWSSIVYGEGKFVAVSLDGKTAYSNDGINFTSGTIPNAQWTNITYGEGLFVTVSADGKVAYSKDGITFDSNTIPNEKWNSIIYGNNKFVTVSTDGNIAYSVPDEIIPTFCDIVFSNFSGGISNNNEFLAISSNGPIFYGFSENMLGANILTNGNWNGITYGNGRYIAVGDNGSVTYSEDGKLFARDVYGKISNHKWRGITYGNGKFVAISDLNIAYRTDTKDKEDFIDGTIPDGIWRAITYANSLFVAVAYDGKIAYSTDGITFQLGTIPPSSWCSVAFGNGVFVAVADNGNTAYSTDGKTFNDGSGPTGFWTSVAFLDKSSGLVEEPLFIMTSTNGKIAYSTDGKAFLEYKGEIPEKEWNSITFMANPNVMVLMNNKNIYAVKVEDSDEPTPPTPPTPPGPSNFLNTGFRVLKRISPNLVTIYK